MTSATKGLLQRTPFEMLPLAIPAQARALEVGARRRVHGAPDALRVGDRREPDTARARSEQHAGAASRARGAKNAASTVVASTSSATATRRA